MKGAAMSRPGTVITLERNSPPMMFNAGDGFHYEKLPEGTRVIYPPGPVDSLADPNVAIERALLEPLAMEPLHELLFPGMKLTIAFDDLSLPLPPMRRPDIRQLVIEKVLERLYNYDAEDPDGNIIIGETERGEEVSVGRRVAESDLLVYVNINYIPMDGGHKSVHTGLAPYSSIRHHHNPDTLSHTRSLMDPPNSAMHSSFNRMGKLLDENIKVFHIETTLNNAAFPSVFDFMAKPEHEWGPVTKANFLANHRATSIAPRRLSRRIFQSIKAPHRMTSVQAGATDPVHAETLKNSYEQMVVPVEGQSDVLLLGIPYLGPYNVNSIMNPLLVYNMLLGYLFNLYRGKPLVREGGVLIGTHPMPEEFHGVHHPSYIDLWNEAFPETNDIREIHQRYEEKYALDPWYKMLYRNSHAYHGVHPFTVLYWAAHALDHLGDAILVGGDPTTTKRMGLKRADSIAEALEMAQSTVGPSPSTTYMHIPPLFMCEVS